MIVASYGRGLWKIHTRVMETPFPFKSYCRDKYRDCRFLLPFSPKPPVYEKMPWGDKDVTIFLNGRVNGLILSGSKIKMISVTPGSTFKRYIGKTKDFSELNIVESEQGQGFDELKGCRTAVESGEIIKGIILKENEIIGIIAGKTEFKEEEKGVIIIDPNSRKGESEKGKNDSNYKFKDKSNTILSRKPYLFVSTSIPIMGTSVVGNDGVINLFAKGFKFYPKGNNQVRILIDSQVVHKNAKVLQNGNVESRLKVQES